MAIKPIKGGSGGLSGSYMQDRAIAQAQLKQKLREERAKHQSGEKTWNKKGSD